MGLRMCSPTRPKNSAVYTVRKRVPEDLRRSIGKREIKRSLQTRDPVKARKVAPLVCAEIDRYFTDVRRSQSLGRKDLEGIAGEYFRRRMHALIVQAKEERWDESAFAGYEEFLSDVSYPSTPAGVSFEDYEERRNQHVAKWGRHAVGDILEEKGLWPSPHFLQRLGEKVYTAELQATRHARAEVLAEHSAPSLPSYATTKMPSRRSLADLWPDYEKHARINGKASGSLDSWKGYVHYCSRFFGDKPAEDVTADDMWRYVEGLRQGHSPSGKPLKAKSINQSHLVAVRAVYHWAKNRELVSHSPADGIWVEGAGTEADEKHAYTREMVRTILEAARKEANPVRRWAPWLCAFTGARIGEILGLLKRDVKQTEGIYYLSLQKNAARTLKNAQSNRHVPIHPALVREGFLDYVDSLPAHEEYLFPGDWGRGKSDRTKTPANRLRDWLNTLHTNEERQGFSPNHSFRHWLISQCRQASIDPDYQRVLTGHRPMDIHARYGPGDIPTLYAAIQQIPSPLDSQGGSGSRIMPRE